VSPRDGVYLLRPDKVPTSCELLLFAMSWIGLGGSPEVRHHMCILTVSVQHGVLHTGTGDHLDWP
jgi:hypothetical protein